MPSKPRSTCPVCGSGDCRSFFELGQVPVNVCVQWATRREAIDCPRGRIDLFFCGNCGFIWNAAFDALRLDYTQAYENSLFFSPLYEEYSTKLAQRLIDRYNLRGKDVIDIGCGKGDFLFLLSRLGNSRGTGFDTSYEGADGAADERVTIVRDLYSKKYAGYKADLICSRYVFEHIEQPAAFLRTIREAIGDNRDTVVYFEVPNVSLILRDLSVWDIIYEHCSYFGMSSLRFVFGLCGFDVLDAYESYGGQFLGLEARPAAGAEPPRGDAGGIAGDVGRFVAEYRRQVETWQGRLEAARRAGKKTVLWGAGAKGVSFLNMLEAAAGTEYVVDINHRKHGKHIAGTGQEIVGPDFLRGYRPDIVIITNPIYREEIAATVNRLGIDPELLVQA